MNPIYTAGAQAAKHAIMRTISVVCVLAVIAGIWFAVDKAFIHPRDAQTTNQTADKIVNYHIETKQDNCWVDLRFLGMRLQGFCWQTKDKEVVIQDVATDSDTQRP